MGSNLATFIKVFGINGRNEEEIFRNLGRV